VDYNEEKNQSQTDEEDFTTADFDEFDTPNDTPKNLSLNDWKQRATLVTDLIKQKTAVPTCFITLSTGGAYVEK